MIAALPPVHCIIEHHKETGGAMTLVPTIESDGRGEGTYQFEIFSNSNGNRSSNVQGGDFQKDDPGRLALSRSTVSVSPNGGAPGSPSMVLMAKSSAWFRCRDIYAPLVPSPKRGN